MDQDRNRRGIQDILEFNEYKYTIYPSIWGTMKSMIRGKFIALRTFVKTLERSHTSNLNNTHENSRTNRSNHRLEE